MVKRLMTRPLIFAAVVKFIRRNMAINVVAWNTTILSGNHVATVNEPFLRLVESVLYRTDSFTFQGTLLAYR